MDSLIDWGEAVAFRFNQTMHQWINESILFLPPVPQPVHRVDAREPGVALLELAPQALDVAVDRALGDVSVVGIGLFHELLARLDVPGMAGQRLEQQELGHRQRDRLAVPSGEVPQAVELEQAGADDLLLLAARGIA